MSTVTAQSLSTLSGSTASGTFTATVTLVGGAGNTVPVYTTNTGRYTRVGSIVFVDIYLTGDGGNEGAGSGQINIALPVAATATHPTSLFPAGIIVNNADTDAAFGQIAGGASTVALFAFRSATSITALIGDDQNNATRTIRLKFFYEVA